MKNPEIDPIKELCVNADGKFISGDSWISLPLMLKVCSHTVEVFSLETIFAILVSTFTESFSREAAKLRTSWPLRNKTKLTADISFSTDNRY